MRILTVGNMYPPHHQGGYEQDWAAAVQALEAAGHQLMVLASDHRERGIDQADAGRVDRTLRWYWSNFEFPRRRMRECVAIERHNAEVLSAALHDFQPDLVSWWPMGGMSLALIDRVAGEGLPAVGVVYDEWMVYGPRADGWQSRWRGHRKWFASIAGRIAGVPTPSRFADAARWLFASEAVRRASERAVGPIPASGLLPPSLDEVFSAPAPEREWTWKLFAPGRIDPRKGLRTAIEALAQLPREATLTFAGSRDPQHFRELQHLAAELGVNARVTFQSARPRAELVELYAASDAVLFPVAWAEPFGLVPLEAMSVGRPVVATGRGGSGEFLRDGYNCLIHEPGDARALADALRRLAASAELRARLRAGGHATTPAFSRSGWNRRVVAEHERRAEQAHVGSGRA